MSTSNNAGELHTSGTPFGKLIRGEYFGLAQTYWAFYLIAAALFFGFGSVLVADRNWTPYVGMIVGLVAWSFLLLTGVQRGYKGADPGKALGRIGMLFLLLNLTNILATLSFI
ncbi:MAG: hypothetical protein Q8L60_02760 [Gammaproteobacteria bacterium]|nr:hypothetical protein [Gammaproteobacteria bacterium]MDP2141799.1 hypothetical protein [Gammaproteobacteria bacterium]MDP2348021.1 hypothetical protein [Gammaproteobacteria bacterium]